MNAMNSKRINFLNDCACAITHSTVSSHQPAAGFMRGACRTESDFDVDILTMRMSTLDAAPLRVPRFAPMTELPSASALVLHATVSLIKADKLGFLRTRCA